MATFVCDLRVFLCAKRQYIWIGNLKKQSVIGLLSLALYTGQAIFHTIINSEDCDSRKTFCGKTLQMDNWWKDTMSKVVFMKFSEFYTKEKYSIVIVQLKIKSCNLLKSVKTF